MVGTHRPQLTARRLDTASYVSYCLRHFTHGCVLQPTQGANMGRFVTIVMVLVSAVLIPALAFAQGAITGVVTDSSGAVLPGVTVEVASPVLIERVRSAVSDGTGQYQIVNLPPGAYSVTFMLAGFNTLKREGIELTGNFTATVNGNLRVGALEETVTVTGEAPDRKSTRLNSSH